MSTEGNLRFKIDWANLLVGSKFTVFALFYFVFEGNFPREAYIWTTSSPGRSFLALEVGRDSGPTSKAKEKRPGDKVDI